MQNVLLQMSHTGGEVWGPAVTDGAWHRGTVGAIGSVGTGTRT